MSPVSRRGRGRGAGHVAAFSEIVDSSNVKGSSEGGRVGIGARSVFALDYVAWTGGGSECLFSVALGIRSSDRFEGRLKSYLILRFT